MPSILDPHVEAIEGWLAAEPRITALVILDRLIERCPDQFGPPQHTTVQRLLKTLRHRAAAQLIAKTQAGTSAEATTIRPETGDEVLDLALAPMAALPRVAEGILGNTIS